MVSWNPAAPASRHLYIVAGYPASGKSSSLWKASRTGLPLFGDGHGPVVPPIERLRDVGEGSDSAAKLRAGFWVTLTDLPHLSGQATMPKRLVLHLDLLLTYLFYRAAGHRVSSTALEDHAFASLFAEPALRGYDRCTVTTLHAPLDEIQRRWRHRYPGGHPANCSKVLATKHRLIMDGEVAPPLYASIHAAWDRRLAALADAGVLAGHLKARSRLRADVAVPSAETNYLSAG